MAKVAIIYTNDHLANTQRAHQLKKILGSANHQVTLVNADTVVQAGYRQLHQHLLKQEQSWFHTRKGYYLRRLQAAVKWPSYQLPLDYPFYYQLLQRGDYLSTYSVIKDAEVVICQSPYDMAVLMKLPRSVITVYDAPTIFFEELRYSSQVFAENELAQIFELEERVFFHASFTTFHWHTYASLAEKLFGAKVLQRYVPTGWGATATMTPIKYRTKPSVIYIGNIDDYWTNAPLLWRLVESTAFPIHVYGKTNNPQFRKHRQYRGYISKRDMPNVLKKYQFGLITITNDLLRKKGFSAKHLTYFEHGLPVLVPAWRKDKLLRTGTVSYTEENFSRVITEAHDPQHWHQLQQAAHNTATKLSWKSCFKELITALELVT